MSHALRVCLIADIKFRISVAEKQKKISPAEAAKLIHAMDEDRAVWVNTIYQAKDPWTASLYDIVAPMDKMTQEDIISLIMDNAKKDIS